MMMMTRPDEDFHLNERFIKQNCFSYKNNFDKKKFVFTQKIEVETRW